MEASGDYLSPDAWRDEGDPADTPLRGPDSTRLPINDLQWLAMLARMQECTAPHSGPDRRGETPARERFGINEQYLLRIDDPDHPGTFTIRARNLAAKGLGFVHNEPLPDDTRCTVVLSDRAGYRLILTGRIVWQRPIGPQLYDTGIEFDQPIDVLRFLETD